MPVVGVDVVPRPNQAVPPSSCGGGEEEVEEGMMVMVMMNERGHV